MKQQLLDCLTDFYGTGGRLDEQYSYLDQTFILSAEKDSYVVKAMHTGCDAREIDLQCALLTHLANTPDLPVQQLIPTRARDNYCQCLDEAGKSHLVWVLGFIPGVVAADYRPLDDGALQSLGQTVARLHLALSDFAHPHITRDFSWTFQSAGAIHTHLANLKKHFREHRHWLETTAQQFCDDLEPRLHNLPGQAIHGDINDHNVIYGPTGQVAGLIDFGDAHRAPPVCDLAIAATYFMMNQHNPLLALRSLIRGYHAVRPLAPAELELLYPLIKTRLALSLTHSMHSREQQVDDEYRSISEQPALDLITQLSAWHDGFIGAWIMASAGIQVYAKKWQRCKKALTRTSPAAVMECDWDAAPIIDLSAASGTPTDPFSGLMSDPLTTPDPGTFYIGRYGEPRLVYQSPLFKSGNHPADDARTVHAGVDLFAPAGTPVHAPLAGTVHAIANHTQAQDYGPVVVLRHQLGDDELFTLYGHLRGDVLNALKVGDSIAGGQILCHVGAPPENGDWPPHLHFQCILEDLGWGTDIPGVSYDWSWGVWQQFFPNPGALLKIAEDILAYPDDDIEQLRKRRQSTLGYNLSLAYSQPLKMVRGWQQYLFDHRSRCYLDAYNNVPHVGHCHPRVVAAVTQQMRKLNTNTRYLHDTIVEYAERLAGHFADPLNVCFFVNSASEANELALRLARAATQARSMIVMAGAYHGHTSALIDISPYKADGTGGQGCPDWVHQVPLVDLYRGPFRYDDPHAGARYARHVQDAIGQIHERGQRLCAYICESLPSVGGQLVYPPGYLPQVYRAVHAAGGLCIADEVQTGLGRTGDHFWGFEQQDVQPDIVVLGKPIGNGHPIGAVVTTPAIAQAFANGMEFFSTFGGNTVSCAAGLEVLRVVEEENIQTHIKDTGDYLKTLLVDVTRNHPMIGDVRGMGLFLGIEVVKHIDTREPATTAANHIMNRLRDFGILTGTDGIFDNVLKIRPPAPFNRLDAEYLAHSLHDILNDSLLRSDRHGR